MTKAKELRDQPIEELESSVDEARKALFTLRGEVMQGNKVEKPHRISLQRREIARMLTILHEKQSKRNLRKKNGSRKSRKSQNKKRNSPI